MLKKYTINTHISPRSIQSAFARYDEVSSLNLARNPHELQSVYLLRHARTIYVMYFVADGTGFIIDEDELIPVSGDSIGEIINDYRPGSAEDRPYRATATDEAEGLRYAHEDALDASPDKG